MKDPFSSFCSFDCSFEHSIRGIHAPVEHEDELRFLACAIASPLALYFFFRTAANWGTERAKIHVSEYGRFPFPRPDTKARKRILGELVAAHRQLQAQIGKDPTADFGWEARMQPYEELFDGLVYQYYNLNSRS